MRRAACIGVCARTAPDRRKAAWLHRVLSGDGAPEAAPGGVFWPAPFVWMTDFLAPEECDRLLALGVARHEGLTPVETAIGHKDGGSSSTVDPEVRVGLEGGRSDHEGSQTPGIVPKIRSVLPAVLARLGMAGLDRYQLEVAMRVYLTGGFFQAHRDSAYEAFRSRKLSFVYFFHRRPRRFSGGDLLLYDTDVDAGACDSGAFSRITPLRNGIVFFPAPCWHQATPVQCGTDDFEDGRWVLNGHVRRLDEEFDPGARPRLSQGASRPGEDRRTGRRRYGQSGGGKHRVPLRTGPSVGRGTPSTSTWHLALFFARVECMEERLADDSGRLRFPAASVWKGARPRRLSRRRVGGAVKQGAECVVLLDGKATVTVDEPDGVGLRPGGA